MAASNLTFTDNPEVSKHGMTLLAFLFLKSPLVATYMCLWFRIVKPNAILKCTPGQRHTLAHITQTHNIDQMAGFALQQPQRPSTTEINSCLSVCSSL